MTLDEQQRYIERIASELGEFFDCVQILAHDSCKDTYTCFEAGRGSLFARTYQAMRFYERMSQPENEPEELDDDELV
jgi:hypothetical protein